MGALGPSRRDFLMATTAGAVGMVLPAACAEGEGGHTAVPATLKLGVATYSLRELSRSAAIDAIVALRAKYVNIKAFHLPYESSLEELVAGRMAFESAGLTIVGGGVIALEKDDDDDIRHYFEYAKAAGMPMMIIAPTPATLPRIERFVDEYDIKVAIHNHGPDDHYFPRPSDALAVIRDMDPRVGLCVDLGHTARTGANVLEALAEAGDRLLDIHAKDLTDLRDEETQCVLGDGAMPFPAILRHLTTMRYAGTVDLEYEIDPENPLPGMQRSFAYLRGVLDGLGVSER